MKQLLCRIIGGDWYLDQLKGKLVTVLEISRDCPLWVTARLEESPDLPMLDGCVAGKLLRMDSYCLEPLDTSMVPASHSDTDYLKHVWVFIEARNDAWDRYKPSDLKYYEEKNGVAWEDKRIWDIGRM